MTTTTTKATTTTGAFFLTRPLLPLIQGWWYLSHVPRELPCLQQSRGLLGAEGCEEGKLLGRWPHYQSCFWCGGHRYTQSEEKNHTSNEQQFQHISTYFNIFQHISMIFNISQPAKLVTRLKKWLDHLPGVHRLPALHSPDSVRSVQVWMPCWYLGWSPESANFWMEQCTPKKQMGVSENSVPLNPMVNDHYPY